MKFQIGLAETMQMGRKRSRAEQKDEDADETSPDESVLVIRDTVYFCAPVETKYTMKLLKALNEASEFALKNCTWSSEARVYLYINSGGGCAFVGLSIMDHIRLNRVPIITIADGYVASAATFLLLGGYERKSLANAKILIHQFSTAFWGKYADLLDEAQNGEELMDTFRNVYATQTKLRGNRLNSLLKKELHMSATRSRDCGIIDEIW